MAKSNKEYKKVGTVGGARHGDSFQIHVLMMLYARIAGNNSFANFRLATEWKDAGKFDDVVLVWNNDQQTATQNWLFVQVKHKISPKHSELNENHFFPVQDRSKGDFSMYKYLVSFWDIMDSGEFDGSNHDFVINTNAGLNKEITHWFTDVDVQAKGALKLLGDKGRFLKIKPIDKYVTKLMDYKNKDFNDLLQVMRDAFLNGRHEFEIHMFEKYRGALNNNVLVADKDVVRLAPRFIKKKRLNPPERRLRELLSEENKTLEQWNTLTSRNVQLINVLKSKNDSINTLPRFITKAEVEHFLQNLTIAIEQPNNDDLEIVIKKQFQDQSSRQDLASNEWYTQLMYANLRKMVYDWLDCKSTMCKFMTNNEWTKLSQEVLRIIAESKLETQTRIFKGKMENFLIEFRDCSPIESLIFCSFPVVIFTSTDQRLLTCLKVYRILQNQYFYYFSLTDLQLPTICGELYSFIRNSISDVFIILEDNCPSFKHSSELLGSMLASNRVKLIFITSTEERATNFFKHRPFYSTINDSLTNMNVLSQTSQEMLLQRSLLFQGFELTLNKLSLSEHLCALVNDEILEMLIQDKSIEIGTALPELHLKCYIERTTSRDESEDSANGQDDYDTDSDDPTSNDENQTKSYSEKEFLDHAQRYNRTLLSSTPGMGKTTLWMKLAQDAKKLYPTNWVLYVKLSDCGKKLEALKKLANLEDAIDFLNNILPINSKFEQTLFSKWLQTLPDRVYIFFDGYDELPSEMMERASSLFGILGKARIFVNTRDHQQDALEQAMDVKAFRLEPISKSDQKVLLKSLLVSPGKTSRISDPINKFVKRLIEKIHSKSMEIASNFVGVPLMINMLAEIYKPSVNEHRQTNGSTLLQNIDLETLNIRDLFEMFAYHSFRRQNVEKQNLDEKNYHTIRMLDQRNALYGGFVELHNYLGLISLVDKQKLSLIVRNKRKLSSLEEQADHLLDSFIVPKYSNGVPHFFHSSIAEFFAAKCLYECLFCMSLENIEQNFVKNKEKRHSSRKRYIKDIYDLFQTVLIDYPIVRKFFFMYAKSSEKFLNKLEKMLWCMRPYPLLWVCEENFEELAKRLIEQDPSIATFQTPRKKYALHYAAAHGNTAICSLLIDHKANVNTGDNFNRTALHFAAQKSHYAVVKLLIERGACVDATDTQQQTPLHLASHAGNIEIVEELMKHSSSVNRPKTGGWNCLHIAAMKGHTSIVKLLIAKKVGLDAVKAKNWIMFLGQLIPSKPPELVAALVEYKVINDRANCIPTLLWAVRRDHADVIRVMHQADIDCCIVDRKSGLSTYQIALNCGSFKAAEAILSVQKNLEGFELPLHAAVLAGCAECVEILLNKNIDVNTTDKTGVTPLDIAFKHDNAKIVELLLKNSAGIGNISMFEIILYSDQCAQIFLDKGNLNSIRQAIDNDNRPLQCSFHLAIHAGFLTVAKGIAHTISNLNDIQDPLHLAARSGSIELLQFLIDEKQDVNKLNLHKESALDIAIRCNHPQAARVLLDNGATIGKLSLHAAILTEYTETTECVKLLLEKGADPNEYDHLGRTALHLAALFDNRKCLAILIGSGSSVLSKDFNGRIPLHYAVTKKAGKAIEIFLEHKQAAEMLNSTDEMGRTALHMAVIVNCPILVAKLIDSGACLDARDHKQQTPLQLAIAEKAPTVEQLLIERKEQTEDYECAIQLLYE
ncbi:uncharacterized protein LOC131439404 [Malaya genurostris]|uniref:uncharacterized protein LOC131439404 n=1 Tax=Malaya genurostris TaxID=325434 RepID=UPI0026F3BF95|nr:uncharacterized protein LOC131439404 [Malaya genurostris]